MTEGVGLSGERSFQISLIFSVCRMPRFFGSASDPPLDPAAPDGWHESDLELIDAVGDLGEIALLDLNFEYTPARALSHVKHRVGCLILSQATDQTLADVAALPRFDHLVINDSRLSPAGFKRLAELAENAQSLGFSRYWTAEWPRGIGDDDLASFTRLEKLDKLHVDGSPITSAGIEQVARMTNLEELTLKNCPALADADFTPLARLVRLRDLTIWPRPPIGDDARPADWSTAANRDQLPWGDAIARVAARLPELQTLRLEMPIRHEALQALVESGNLLSLSLELDEVNDESLALVGRLTRLRHLHLRGRGKLSDAGLAHLGNLTGLIEVQLPGAGITDGGLLLLAGLDALHSLGLPGSEITGSALAHCQRWKNLNSLSLASSPFGDEGCRHLAKFRQLRELDLSGTRVTGAGLAELAPLTELCELKLANTPLGDDDCQRLPRPPHLFSLNLSHTRVTDAALEAIGKLPSLYNLYLDGTAVTASGFDYLGNLEHLQRVSVRDTPVRQEAVSRLRSMRRRYIRIDTE